MNDRDGTRPARRIPHYPIPHPSWLQAEACKSVEQAMKRCPNGMYSEIKYDGERVQLHKQGDHFKYFSRALKPVLPHKVGARHQAPAASCVQFIQFFYNILLNSQ